MAVREIESEADFTLRVNHKKGVVMVGFWAVWCDPCKLVRDEIKRAAASVEGRADVVRVDVDKYIPWRRNMKLWQFLRYCFLKTENRSNV